MVIVGLQCGHDASVAVVVDGRIVVHLERERVTRKRHDSQMSADLIHEALSLAGVSPADIGLFALSTTQSYGYQSEDAARLDFEYDWSIAERVSINRFSRQKLERAVSRQERMTYVGRPGGIALYNSESHEMPEAWRTPSGFAAIERMDCAAAREVVAGPGPSMIMPIKVTLEGVAYDGIGVAHQLSHAAAAYYQSGFETASVLAHDNGSPLPVAGDYRGGWLFRGEGCRLRAIWPAPIAAGMLYTRAAEWVGMRGFGGAGKLMGLAAYGTPGPLYDPAFIGDVEALRELYVDSRHGERWEAVLGWARSVSDRARSAGYIYERAPFTPFGKDLAAAAQLTFEQLVLHALAALESLLAKAGVNDRNLCLSGGCALNCPTNSHILERTGFTSVFVPPSCDDGGLSIGAALYLLHDVLGQERKFAPCPDQCLAALGRATSTTEIDRALASVGGEYCVDATGDIGERVAADLASDRIVAFYQGRSESGPRALGHRSLLADPRPVDNWARVNRLKAREPWRPFAPACLSERLRECFDGGPAHSPHMLFNYRVRSKELAAVTHVDGSARVQTVAAGSGTFRCVIDAFARRTGVPVVLNTSMNGPGEPIVDTPAQAIEFLRRSGTDVLYLENRRVSRRA